LVTVAVAWLALRAGPGLPLGPQVPARARAAEAPTPPAKPAKPDPAAIDKTAPPAQQGAANRVRGLWTRMAAQPSAWLKEMQEARPYFQPNPSAPAPAAKPQEPPTPDKAGPSTPPQTRQDAGARN